MPVRVLQVLEAFVGGTRRHVTDLAENLDKNRHNVSVACSTLREPACEEHAATLERQGTRVYRVPMRRAISPVSDLYCLLKLAGIIRSGGFSIVHTHSSKAGFLGRIAARLAGCRSVVHTPHVFPFQMEVFPSTRSFYIKLERLAARSCRKIICVSSAERTAALDAGVAQESQLVVIPNGIAGNVGAPLDGAHGRRPATPLQSNEVPADLSSLRTRLGIPRGGLVVGSVGRLCEQKGHRYLIEAAGLIRDRFADVRFVIAGDGELRPALEELVRARRLDGRFHFAGHVSDPAPLYALFDIVAFPSLWEGLPYALLESMAAGKPVVGTSVGGLGEVIEREHTGVVVPPHDAPALAEALGSMLANSSVRESLGTSSRAAVQKYSLEKMIRATEAVYAEALPQ